MKSSDHRKNRTGIVFLLIFIALAAGILAGGYFAYRNYEQNFRSEVEQQLSAIAGSKVDQLVQWRKKRIADGEVFFRNDAFSVLVKRYLQNPNDQEAKTRILTWAGQVQKAYSYDLMILLDAQFNTKLVLPENRERARLVIDQRNTEILLSGNIAFQDFYRNEDDRRVYLNILVPILDDHSPKRMVAVLALRIDPTQYLYPMMEKWPTMSKTAETLILRRDGNDVLYLNSLKFHKDAALNLRIPLERKDVLAVRAALGMEGVVEGIDYLGEHVIGNVCAVPNSPWFLVARMDYSEVFAPPRERLWIMIILVGALLAGAGASVGLIWRHQRNRFYVEQYKSAEALRETNEYLESLINYANAPIIVWDASLTIIRFNHAFELLSGYGEGEVKGKQIDVLFAKDKIVHSLDLIHSAVGGVRWGTVEIEIQRKDGESRIVLWNSANIPSEDGKSVLATIAQGHDITKRKRAEMALSESEAKFRMLLESAPLPLCYVDKDGVITFRNERFIKVFGYGYDEVPTLAEWWMIAYPEEHYRTWVVQNWDSAVRHAAETGTDIESEVYHVTCKNGSVREIIISGITINDDFLATFVDITDRKRAEEALRESEVRFRQTFDLSPVGIVMVGLDKLFHRTNNAFSHFLGYSAEELAGKTIEDITFAEDRNIGMAEMNAIVKGEIQSSCVEKRYVRKDGKVVWGEVTISLVQDHEEHPQYFLTIIQDVTERKQNEADKRRLFEASEHSRLDLLSILEDQKQAEEALRESQVKYRELFENAQVGMYRSKLDGSALLDVNLKLCEIFGYSEEEMLADAATIRWADPKARDAMATTIMQTASLHDYAVDILTKSGEIRNCSVSIQLYADKGYIEVSVVDITDRKRAEEEIRKLNQELETRVRQRTAELTESEERFRQLAEASYEAIIIHDGGILLRANDQFFKLFGFEPAELLGKQVMPLTTAPDSLEVLKKEIAAGGLGPYEATGLRKDGTTFPMEVRARHMEYEGRPVRVAAIMDITERKQAEEALRERTAALETANKELEAFSYSVSHDLRAPLRAVDGFSRIVLEEYAQKLDPEAGRLLKVICTSTQKMDELITDLLDLSRVSRNEMKCSRLAMAMLVNSIFHESASDDIRETFSFSVAPIPDAYCDPVLIKQVWRNLISNAIKFTMPKDERKIEIGSRSEDGMNVYFIRDSGVGFDPRYSHKLFGVFQRLHKAEEFEGTGVGLAIVQRIIHRHGGKVWAEGKVGEGATFWFSLPNRQEGTGNSQ